MKTFLHVTNSPWSREEDEEKNGVHRKEQRNLLNKDILPLNLASDRPPSESLQNYFHHAKNTFKRIVHGYTGGGIGWKLSNYQGIP